MGIRSVTGRGECNTVVVNRYHFASFPDHASEREATSPVAQRNVQHTHPTANANANANANA